jgi:hypothetical protein
MRVQVEVVCAPHPRKKVKDALQQAGERLALKADSVSVDIDPENPHIAVLTFEMRRAAQYTVVDRIAATVKFWVMAFYEDIIIRFPKD